MVPLVANHWYHLGLQLLDPKYENELDIIEAADMKNDTRTCCRKMFSKWLITDVLASWDKVIEALTLMGLNNVASKIKTLLGQSELETKLGSLYAYQCNARLPLIRAEGGERSGMVGELIAKFPRHSGDLSSLKKFTQSAKMCALSLGKRVGC